MRKQDMEIDYLAPFIARIVQGDKITREEAYMLKTEALKDLKERLINKANLIQARYEKVRNLLQLTCQMMFHQSWCILSASCTTHESSMCSHSMIV